MSIAILVDEGKLEWDKPIKNYIPNFKLYDPYATEHLTIRDILCHRSGLPAHDWSMDDIKLTRKDKVGLLQYLEPNYEMRQKLNSEKQNFSFLKKKGTNPSHNV
ncbi:MAG: serine hydrolase [Clostridiaceae bacterium]|nr:serine hydrolase [Clostridiaceae bacterium]